MSTHSARIISLALLDAAPDMLDALKAVLDYDRNPGVAGTFTRYAEVMRKVASAAMRAEQALRSYGAYPVDGGRHG